MSDPEETQDASIATAATLPTEAPASLRFPVTGWDRYDFLGVLGHGGMGVVYRARDRRLGREVALKFIRGGDPRLTMRLLQEARTQARIDHEGVCNLFEVGEVQGRAYIAVQLIDGHPLGDVAARMSLHDKVQVSRDVARALHQAHQLGVLHRDIKPTNILVETTQDGRFRPVVMDFGLARQQDDEHGLTETGALLGTPAYMSPEQARGGGRGLDRRSDVYSLGATLYHLLAGAPPFDGDSAMRVVLAVISEEPAPLRARAPSVPADLETIVAKCLSKDPGQRYDSARALADDLDRYIRGEPILGRRESLVRRLSRKARENRALVATAILALVAVVVVGGIGLRARVNARRQAAELEAQAQLGRELEQDVKEMEWFLRTAHLLPLHDVTREHAIVRARMQRLAERAPSGAARAMVDYALGRGHLALREDAAAHERLAAALDGGLDTPELHYARGLVLGHLYDQAMAEARQGGDPRWIEQRTKEIEAQHLRPALDAMERSRAVRIESPSYLAGLVAHYRKDHDGALRLAQKAREEAPWLYEATALEAAVHLERGVERKDRGDNEGAVADFAEASRLFDAAAEVGRSDAGLYEGSARAWSWRMQIHALSGISPKDELDRALERCEKAAAVTPNRSAPYTGMAEANRFMGMYALDRGGDPRPAMARTIAAAEQALRVGGEAFSPYEETGSAYYVIATYELVHGIDPRRSVEEAIARSRRAVELGPRQPWAHVALGLGHESRARARAATGEDAAADFLAAIDAFGKAGEIDPDYVMAYSNPLFTLAFLTQWRASRGDDPGPEVERRDTLFAACVRVNPRMANCYENAGILDFRLAEARFLAGEDPAAELGRAREQLEKASTLDKDYIENVQYFAELHLLRARDALRRGEDPGAALAAMGEALAACRRLASKDATCTLLDARRGLLAADLPAKPGRPDPAALEAAHALAVLAVERNPRDADAHQVLAEAELRLASSRSPAQRREHLAAGLAASERGLAVNPNHARLFATRGALLLLEPDGDARVEAARRAAEALRLALARNPRLRGELRPLLEEAERRAH
jgi:serine/threonine-protein kinase